MSAEARACVERVRPGSLVRGSAGFNGRDRLGVVVAVPLLREDPRVVGMATVMWADTGRLERRHYASLEEVQQVHFLSGVLDFSREFCEAAAHQGD